MKPVYRIVLANFVHWVAIRSLRVGTSIVKLMLIYSIRLNPRRKLFRENLKKLQNKHFANAFYSKKFPYYSFSKESVKSPNNFTILSKQKQISLNMPKIVNKGFKINPKHECVATLPATYLAEIQNAQIFTGTDLIISDDRVLYDEIARDEVSTDAIMSNNIAELSKEEVTIKIPDGKLKIIETGIHMVKDYSTNYFHWVVEALPRLSLVSDLDNNIPLLVDSHLPFQCYEALDILNAGKRKIIKLDTDKSYIVKRLFYPSALSEFHDNYNEPMFDKDCVYSPEAIGFVRNQVLSKFEKPVSNKKRRIFISRKNSDYRQLLNSEEVEQILLDRGFEVVFPENLSFAAQVRIFSQAEIVVGQSGAGMTNMIFVPKECKVLMLLSDLPMNNLHIFNALALVNNIKLEFILGKYVVSRLNRKIHSDFYINIKDLIEYLENNDAYSR